MIEQIRSRVEENLQNLDGIIALRLTEQGTTPYLYKAGDDVAQLVMEPRYPVSETVSKLQKRFRDANIGIVARGCDARALVEMVKRYQIDPNRLYLIGVACSLEQADTCHCSDPYPILDQWPRSELIGEPIAGAASNPLVAEYENIPREDRWSFWKLQFT